MDDTSWAKYLDLQLQFSHLKGVECYDPDKQISGRKTKLEDKLYKEIAK